MKQDKRRIISRRYCDEAMADKKGFFPCDHVCKTCICCIEVEDDGDRCHYDPLRGLTRKQRSI